MCCETARKEIAAALIRPSNMQWQTKEDAKIKDRTE